MATYGNIIRTIQQLYYLNISKSKSTFGGREMRKKKGFVSIKTKFIGISIAISLLLTMSISYIWYTTTLKNAKTAAIDYMAAIIQQSNQHLDGVMRDIGNIVNLLAFDKVIQNTLAKERPSIPIDLLNDQRKVGEILYRICSFRSSIRGIKVISEDGRFYEFGTTMLYEDIVNSDWVDRFKLEKDKQIISPHYYQNYHTESLSDGNKVISMGRAIYDETKTDWLGFVLVDMEAGLLQKIYNMDLKDDASIFIINKEDNSQLYASKHNGIILDDRIIELLDMTEQQGIMEVKIKGETYVLVYNTTHYAKWTTLGVIPEKKLLEDYYNIREIVLIVSVIITVVALAFINLTSSMLTRNIRILHNTIKNISKDNLDCTVEIKAKDEIGQLSHQFVYLINRIKVLIGEIKYNEKKKKQAELNALKAQMNPHFLFNTLNTIKFLGMMQKADNIVKVSESLSTLMHINMESRHFINMEEEFCYIESYMAIQKYKFTHGISHELRIKEELKSLYIPKLMLQPIVENALKHGLTDQCYKGKVIVKVLKNKEVLTIHIIDNGKGMDLTKGIPEGIGMTNTRQRLKLYFGDKATIAISSRVGYYTKVTLSLPVITEKEIDNYE